MQPEPTTSSRRSIAEIARYFARLGFTAFGGPAAHIAMMEEELIHRRAWLSHQHFLDLLAAVNFIPGPNSTELAIALGRLRGGWRGLIVAGICFICPAVLIILPISWLYVNYHQLPHVAGILGGVSAAVVAIVAAAVIRLGASAVKNGFTAIVAIFAALLETVGHLKHWPWADISILASAAIVGVARARWMARSNPSITLRSFFAFPFAAIGLPTMATLGGIPLMILLFLKIGATLFGSGYVLTTYLQSTFVDDRHWLTSQQVLDAVAVGQVTPGPLLTTATFVGFILAHNCFGGGLGTELTCALAATAAIFLPAFVLITILGPELDRLRQSPNARGALDAMNAAVTGLVAATCFVLAQAALNHPKTPVISAIMIASLFLLFVTKINSTWLIAAAAIFGWMLL